MNLNQSYSQFTPFSFFQKKGKFRALWVIYVVLLILIFITSHTIAQTNPYLQTSKSGTCLDKSTQIFALTNGTFLGWSTSTVASATIQNPLDANTYVEPILTTTYTAKAKYIGDNMVVNGDFENGNQGFTSDYVFKDTSSLKNTSYTITSNPYSISKAYIKQKDHTSGSGKMLLADGATKPNKIVYSTPVSVTEGTEYIFTIWFANTHQELANPTPDTSISPPIHLSFLIDTVSIGSYKTTPDTAWYSYTTIWKATSSTTININVIDLTTSLKGNDFVMDDISFKPILYKQSSITVEPCNHAKVFSPDGDGNADTYYISDPGNAKIFDLDGNLIRELQAPCHWDGLKNSGSPAAMGYYAIVVGGSKISKVSLVR